MTDGPAPSRAGFSSNSARLTRRATSLRANLAKRKERAKIEKQNTSPTNTDTQLANFKSIVGTITT
jgi:hypothetical protein